MINEILSLALTCAPYISPEALTQIIRVESAGNIYAIGINGRNKLPRQPKNKEEAYATFEYLHAQRIAFGAGIMQIDSQHHRRLGWGANPEKAFNVCENLTTGHNIFTDCYNRAVLKGFSQSLENNIIVPSNSSNSAYTRALSCYNTGGFNYGFQNGYVNKAITLIKRETSKGENRSSLISSNSAPKRNKVISSSII